MAHFYYKGEGIVWLEDIKGSNDYLNCETLSSADIDYFISLLNYIYYESNKKIIDPFF